jgi:hypothetical protein
MPDSRRGSLVEQRAPGGSSKLSLAESNLLHSASCSQAKALRRNNAGPPCPRCRRPMEVCQHNRICEKHRRQPYHYSQWYRCGYPDCRTTLVMPPEFIVWNDNERGQQLRRLRAIQEQLRPRGEWGRA